MTVRRGKGERWVGAPPLCEGQSEGRAKKDGKERSLETAVLANVSIRHCKGRYPVGPRLRSSLYASLGGPKPAQAKNSLACSLSVASSARTRGLMNLG